MQSKTQFQWEIQYPSDETDALTRCLQIVRIINSMRNPWPIFRLTFDLDNQDILENIINGTEDLQLKIWYIGENGEKIDEPVTFTLLYLEANLDLPQKVADNLTDKRETQRRRVEITFLAKPAYLTMTAFINKLWQEEAALRPLDFLKEIFVLRGIDYSLIKEDGVNMETVNQLLIPPMTVKSAIDYIDEKFGIYKGPLFRYCNYAGQILLWDLSKKYELQKPDGFTKHHKLPSYTKDDALWQEVNDEVINTPNTFITYDEVKTLNYANSILFKYGYDITQIIHPHEDIVFFQKKNFDEIITEFGFWHDKPEVDYHKAFKNRKIYYTDNKGFETGDSYTGIYDNSIFTNKLASDFMDMSAVKFSFYRNIKIHFCMKVGETLYLKPHSEHEKDIIGMNYEGAYMVETSDIIFMKNPDNIECHCTMTAFRSRMSKD